MQQGFKFGQTVQVAVKGFYEGAVGAVCARSNDGRYLVKLYTDQMPDGFERTFMETELKAAEPPARPARGRWTGR